MAIGRGFINHLITEFKSSVPLNDYTTLMYGKDITYITGVIRDFPLVTDTRNWIPCITFDSEKKNIDDSGDIYYDLNIHIRISHTDRQDLDELFIAIDNVVTIKGQDEIETILNFLSDIVDESLPNYTDETIEIVDLDSFYHTLDRVDVDTEYLGSMSIRYKKHSSIGAC